MDSRNIDSPIIDLEDGTVVRLLPYLDKNGFRSSTYLPISHCWNSDKKYMFNEDLDYPIMDDLKSLWWRLKNEGKEFPFSIINSYYMYCMDYKFDIKILKFSESILHIIQNELKSKSTIGNSILNTMCGRALKISRKSNYTPFPSFSDSKFIDVEPFSIAVNNSGVDSYIMNNREVTIESLVNRTSWYKGKNRRDIIKTLIELDPDKFHYIKKFGREDSISDLLGEKD